MERALALAAILACPATLAYGATGIPGVRCAGGFFAKLPGTRISWVNTDENRMVEVYSGAHPIVGLVECGSGVISVFEAGGANGGGEHYQVYYSPDCRSIGNAEGQSVLVHEGANRIVRMERQGDGVVTTFADDSQWHSADCKALGEEPSERLR
jgi:hypothetical protein